MQFDISLFLSALGLAFILESCLYALFPGKMKQLLLRLSLMPDTGLRRYGFGGLAVGLIVLWLSRL